MIALTSLSLSLSLSLSHTHTHHIYTSDVWKEQTWDGFHFERIYHCRPEKAKALAYNNTFYNIYGYWMKWPNAGALEQQLAQSLLNRLLYNCLVNHFGDSPKKKGRD